MNPEKHIKESVKNALYEDLQGQKDITSLLVPKTRNAKARVITREDMILCGKQWVTEVFKQTSADTQLTWNFNDGDKLDADSVIFEAEGPARALLTSERTALNFLQTLSGVATITGIFVSKLEHTSTKLLDTRKTIPGLRLAQKYAVRTGGGHNHRMGLFDAFLIKENHILACGSISKAIEAAREIDSQKPVEVETENLDEFNEALRAGADIIMLDNYSLEDMAKAVKINAGKAKLEVSGDVNLQNISRIAQTGVEFISSGSLTKHIKAINLSMRFDFRLY
jgi:nicotinate-nucleotide pyrophosphorylase (carboxylating)